MTNGVSQNRVRGSKKKHSTTQKDISEMLCAPIQVPNLRQGVMHLLKSTLNPINPGKDRPSADARVIQ